MPLLGQLDFGMWARRLKVGTASISSLSTQVIEPPPTYSPSIGLAAQASCPQPAREPLLTHEARGDVRQCTRPGGGTSPTAPPPQ